jgi:hypothetical protein
MIFRFSFAAVVALGIWAYSLAAYALPLLAGIAGLAAAARAVELAGWITRPDQRACAASRRAPGLGLPLPVR